MDAYERNFPMVAIYSGFDNSTQSYEYQNLPILGVFCILSPYGYE